MAITLSQSQKSAVDLAITLIGFGVGFIASNVAAFPLQDQAMVSTITAFAARELSHVAVYADTGQAPAPSTVAQDIVPVWSTIVKDNVTKKIDQYVTNPTENKLAQAVIAEVDQQIQALAAQSPPSPLAAFAVAKAQPQTLATVPGTS